MINDQCDIEKLRLVFGDQSFGLGDIKSALGWSNSRSRRIANTAVLEDKAFFYNDLEHFLLQPE